MAVKPTVILTRLDEQARFMRRRFLLALVLGALLAAAVPLLAISLVDREWILGERASGLWALGCVLAGLAALAGGYLARRQRLPGRRQVAAAVEADHPQYMDSLMTAVELLERPVDKLNPLNHALLVDVTRKLLGEDLAASVRRRVVGPGRLAAMAAVVAASAAVVAFLQLPRKAAWFWHDTFTGQPSGLVVTPGDKEIPAGDDITIAARINRGPQQARIRLWTERGPIVYDLYATGDTGHSIDLYGIDADFTYQVFTPTLTSPRYRITTFRRPEIKTIAIKVEPPAYTGLAASTTDQLVDLAAPRDSAITVTLTANMPVEAALVPESGTPVQLGRDGDAYSGRFTLDRTLKYKLQLDDLRGHVVPTAASYTIECIEDTPPVVQFITPEEESDKTPEEQVDFEIGAFDNYGIGLVQLHYSVNGGPFEAEELYRSPSADDRQTELAPRYTLPLKDKVKPGDVVYYYASAADNHQPKALESRTEIRFIEIRPPKSLQEMEKMQGGGGGPSPPSLNLDISDLILAQKQLIRQTFRLSDQPDSPARRQAAEELTVAAADQFLNASKRYDDIKEKAGGRSLGVVDKLFPEALGLLTNANTLLKSGAVAESLPFHQRTLSKLVAIEIELLKNAKPRQGSGSGQKSQQPPQDSQNSNEQNQEKQQQEKIQGLQRLVDKLKDLAQREQNLVGGIERHRAGDQIESAFRPVAGSEQQSILGAAFDVRNDLQQVPEAFDVVKELAKATHHMTNTRQGIQLSRAEQSMKEGKLAEQFLRRSQELLDKLVGDLSGNQLMMASKMLDNLRERQKELRQETTQASGKSQEEQQALPGKQKGIRDDYNSLLEGMGRAAAALDEQNPQAAKSLSEALDKARQANVDGTMKRAENALAYSRHERAAQYEQQAEDALGQLAKQLKEAAQQAGGATKEQLTRMLKQTLDDLAGMQKLAEHNADAEQKAAQAKRMKEHLKEMAGKVDDKRLRQLQEAAENIGVSSGEFSPENVQQMMSVMAQAARVLESKITELDVIQRVVFSRMAGREPPDEYRKLVNEYFKNLSEQD